MVAWFTVNSHIRVRVMHKEGYLRQRRSGGCGDGDGVGGDGVGVGGGDVGALPDGKPLIVSDRERYDPGDTLRANCSLPASRPTARLSFTLNNSPGIEIFLEVTQLYPSEF
ncbi:hypothetical protein M0802_005863 [Mischocyttarus mexicanus]|nr:hypothetical protein M0802_005863 [Mischocyttarus mexicanus]